MNHSNNIELLVRFLAQGNQTLACEVMPELKELLIDDLETGWQVNTHNTLRLAFELDKASEEPPLPSQMETHQLLLESGANPALVNQIFACKGVKA